MKYKPLDYSGLNNNNPFLHSSAYLSDLLSQTNAKEDIQEIMEHIDRHQADEIFNYAEVMFDCERKIENILKRHKAFYKRQQKITERMRGF